MRWRTRLGPAALLAGSVAGCSGAHTSQIPLEKNVWQIETQAYGTSALHADDITARRAAELTLAQGYEKFTIAIPPLAALAEAKNDNASRKVIVNVVMFHAGAPEASRALDAADYLRTHAP